MSRDKHRDSEHFQCLVESKIKSHEGRVEKFALGKIKQDRIIPVKQSMVTNLTQKLVAKYSAGLSVEELDEDFETILNLMEESWTDGKRKLVGPGNKVMDHYVIDAHTQLLRILSVGFLLGSPIELFERLDNIIRDDNVIDLVFEFILAAKLNSREIRQEKHEYSFKSYHNLKEAIKEKDKEEAEKLIAAFLDKEWLRDQKKAQMLTEPSKDWYYGRWSFESAAIVAIKDLDDSSFRDNEYYPKDLVDYYRSTLKGLIS